MAVSEPPALPVDGVALILGNSVAGSGLMLHLLLSKLRRPWLAVSLTRIKSSILMLCVQWHSWLKYISQRMITLHRSMMSFGLFSRCDLVTEWRADCSLKVLLEMARASGEVKNHAQCYLNQDDVLMRQSVPLWEHLVGEPVYQVVVPSRYSRMVLQEDV